VATSSARHGRELAQLVGDILRAEGFVTNVSPAGPDGGVDILAGQGGMGFDGARLAVQVKSGAQLVDAPTLRELQGVMSNFGAARGLLVSWAGSPSPPGQRPGACSSRSVSGTPTRSLTRSQRCTSGCRRDSGRAAAAPDLDARARRYRLNRTSKTALCYTSVHGSRT
jgi:Restriction endonuclease